jgi:ribosomal protein S27E
VPKCPNCDSELIEIVRASPVDYSGSIDVFIVPDSEISIKYYKCSNPECPYRQIIYSH